MYKSMTQVITTLLYLENVLPCNLRLSLFLLMKNERRIAKREKTIKSNNIFTALATQLAIINIGRYYSKPGLSSLKLRTTKAAIYTIRAENTPIIEILLSFVILAVFVYISSAL